MMYATVATTFMQAVMPCLCLISMAVVMAGSEVPPDGELNMGEDE